MVIIVLGHTSFVAQGLVARLRGEGHEVWTYQRKSNGEAHSVSGNLLELDRLAWPSKVDTLINFVVLKDDSLEANVAFCDALLRLCKSRGIGHLIHLSSISVYPGVCPVIQEDTEMETDPNRKGSYGSLKVAADLRILAKRSPGLKLSLVRPGFVLGPGVVDPIIGNAMRTFLNRPVLLGNKQSTMPMISRELVQAAILRRLDAVPDDLAVDVLVSPDSPTRGEYLTACCELLGLGKGVFTLPSWLWLAMAAMGQFFLKALGKDMPIWSKFRELCSLTRFDSTVTARNLHLDFSLDWHQALQDSFPNQVCRFEVPSVSTEPSLEGLRLISFIGFGRIVRQKHLPALKHFNFNGETRAFDLRAFEADSGQTVQALSELNHASSGLWVVATPGMAHIEAVDLLREKTGPILVEKPLAYSKAELEQWMELARQRPDFIYVCHNYRYKANTLRMLDHLRHFNPGRLLRVDLIFQGLPVGMESTPWLRNELRSRTLLMDHAIHFMDLATMFCREPMSLLHENHARDQNQRTMKIDGAFQSGDVVVNFLIRQGVQPRRTRIEYHFQNYSCVLFFFPDSFTVRMTGDSFGLAFQEGAIIARSTVGKVYEKLAGKDSDLSHARVLALAASNQDGSLTVQNLANFYDAIFTLAESVYPSRLES